MRGVIKGLRCTMILTVKLTNFKQTIDLLNSKNVRNNIL